MSEVRHPILLDSTGQDIVNAINALGERMNPNASVLYTPQTLTAAQKAVARANIGAMANTPTGSNFAEMQAIVRAGHAPEVYPSGYIFDVSSSSIMQGLTVGVPGQVVAFDKYKLDPENPDEHTMVVLAYLTLASMQFDAPEAFYNTGDNGLAVGNYKFKLGNTTYYFAVSTAIPPHRQLYKQSNTLIYVYDPANPTSSYEMSIPMSTTALSDPTDLGNSGASDKKVNHDSRVSSGSNNYAQCAPLQWMNSDKPRGQWWEAKTPFDRPPSNLASIDGFLYGLNPDFLSIVGDTTVTCRTNTVYEYGYTPGDTYTVTSKFFLPALVNLGLENTNAEGEVWGFYEGSSAADRIKYALTATGSPQNWWTRTRYAGNTYYTYYVTSSGTSYSYSSNSSYGIVAACTIR